MSPDDRMFPIEVRVDQTGETAEADSPEAALLAAKTLLEEAYKASGGGLRELTASFYVNGECVRGRVPENALWADIVYEQRERRRRRASA